MWHICGVNAYRTGVVCRMGGFLGEAGKELDNQDHRRSYSESEMVMHELSHWLPYEEASICELSGSLALFVLSLTLCLIFLILACAPCAWISMLLLSTACIQMAV